MKSHSKALVFFAVSKQIPVVYSVEPKLYGIVYWNGMGMELNRQNYHIRACCPS